MFQKHNRIVRGAMVGVGLFALAGSMNAATAAPQVDSAMASAAALNGAVTALPRFEPADALEESVGDEVQAAAEDILRDIGGGLASWYGPELAGRRTASGERFNPADYTAAHRSLPFGSKVRVTSVVSGRSVVVRINDRGPFARARVIDVSQAAARELGLVASGSGQVRLQLLSS